MAKMKMNANVKRAAQMGGGRVPPTPKVPVKTPEQLKKQAEARAKARMKRLVRVLIVGACLGVVALVVYFVKFYGRMPKDALKTCIEYAYKDNGVKFRECFTADSIEMVESMGENSEAQWAHLMDGITPIERPKIEKEKIVENKGFKTADLVVRIDGESRPITMRQEDGAWKINLNVAINPRKIELPADVPPDYIDNFEVSDEMEAWWEEDGETGEQKKDAGFFSRLMSGKLFKRK